MGINPTKQETKFSLGQIVATPNAIEQLSPSDMARAIARHHGGDWGDVCDADRQENELSLKEGFRLMSVYHGENGQKHYVITEADRSATTILMPEDY
jgi:hypothetical protein